MSKPLSKFHGQAKVEAIKRRVASKTGGLGYLSAVAAVAKGALSNKVEAPAPVEPVPAPSE
jgi:hypothetical protein